VRYYITLFFVLIAQSLLAATGDIIYQKCTAASSCTGAYNNAEGGYIRTLETLGCYSGECLKLEGTYNPLPNGDIRYGSGNHTLTTNAISGYTEITTSSWAKYSEPIENISRGNIKLNRFLIGTTGVLWASTITPHPMGDWYVDRFIGDMRPATWLDMVTYNQNMGYPHDNGDGTYTSLPGQGWIAADLDSGTPANPGTSWVKWTEWVKLPSSPSAADGEIKYWLNNELLIHMYNGKFKDTPDTASFKTFVMFPSSEAKEPFSWWQDEIIVYEGYVPPDESPPAPQITCYSDYDLDLYPGVGNVFPESCPSDYYIPGHFVSMTEDCNDTDNAINPGSNEICGNAVDEDCSGLADTCPEECTDADGDSYSIEGDGCGPVDCADSNASINPGAADICGNDIDEDCSGSDAVCGEPSPAGAFWLYKNSAGDMYIPELSPPYLKVPILLMHGMYGSGLAAWPDLIPQLVAAGYDENLIFAPSMDVDNNLLCSEDHMPFVAAQIAAIKASTGSQWVDFIGHSRGAKNGIDYMRLHSDGVTSIRNFIATAGAINACPGLYPVPDDPSPGDDTLYTSLYSDADEGATQEQTYIEGGVQIEFNGLTHGDMKDHPSVVVEMLNALGGSGTNNNNN
jgi:pimeloyl-ACP methyl ester carboxylesterase